MFTRKSFVVFLACTLFLAACGRAPATEAAPVQQLSASLAELQGGVGIKNDDAADFVPAQTGMTLNVDGVIRTESDGRARLDLSSGTIVRVAPASVFTLVSNEPQADQSLATKIKLELGQIFIVLNGGSMDIDTPSGQASVRGSYLMVFIDPNTLDVYLTCLEGDCGAGNDSGKIIFVTGQSVRLMHGKPGDKPIPPIFAYMTDEDFEEWLEKVPEAKKILESVFATLTALAPTKPAATSTATATPTKRIPPTFTATSTETITPTPERPACTTLLTPPDGAELKAAGKELFTWTAFPGAAKYIVQMTHEKGGTFTFTKTEPSMTIYIENVPPGGKFSWVVVPVDANEKRLCESAPFTFTKPDSSTATPIPSGGGGGGGKVDLNPMSFFNERSTESPTCTGAFYIFIADVDGIVGATVYWKDSAGVGGSATMSIGFGDRFNGRWDGSGPFSGYPNGGKIIYSFVATDSLGNSAGSGGYSMAIGSCP